MDIQNHIKSNSGTPYDEKVMDRLRKVRRDARILFLMNNSSLYNVAMEDSFLRRSVISEAKDLLKRSKTLNNITFFCMQLVNDFEKYDATVPEFKLVKEHRNVEEEIMRCDLELTKHNLSIAINNKKLLEKMLELSERKKFAAIVNKPIKKNNGWTLKTADTSFKKPVQEETMQKYNGSSYKKFEQFEDSGNELSSTHSESDYSDVSSNLSDMDYMFTSFEVVTYFSE